MPDIDLDQGGEAGGRWESASRHMLAWVLACVGYVATVTALAPGHKITFVSTFGFLGPQAALLTWFTLLAGQVRRGQRHRVALWAMCVYTCLGTIAVAMAIGAFNAGRAAIPHAVAWAFVVLTAVLGARAALRAGRESADPSVP